jgi:hypothetical protein
MELAQDRVQWRALLLAVLNRRVLLPGSQLISNRSRDGNSIPVSCKQGKPENVTLNIILNTQ